MVRTSSRRRALAATGVLSALTLASSLAFLPSSSAATVQPGSLGKGQLAPRASSPTPSGKVARPALPAVKTYSQVISPAFTDTAGAETFATLACPAGTKVVGGGAVISSLALTENINSSAPATDGKSWRVWVNNSGTVNGSFFVYANCAAGVGLYQVVAGTSTPSPAGSQARASVTCPAGKVPYGGGAVISSSDTAANLNSTIPIAAGWQVDANNGTATATSVTAYAVCGKQPKKYVQVTGTGSTANPSAQTRADATCPTGTVPFGGGAYSSSGSVLVNLNSSLPLTTGWRAYVNNASTSASTFTAYAVCGKVTV